MRTTSLIVLVLAVALVCTCPTYAGVRCENDIISIGDTPSEVMIKLSKCGEVLNKEIVSKETTVETNENVSGQKIKKEKYTEVWYIRVKERGSLYCYPLSFVEGRLQSIGKWSKCD